MFDGNDNTISNFTYQSSTIDYIGLFGSVQYGQIKNLGLIDPNVSGGTGFAIGTLAGSIEHGTATECYAEGVTVSGSGVGGLVGYTNRGYLVDCHATGDVKGDDYVGGLIGQNHGDLDYCHAMCSVEGDEKVGGLVGRNNGGLAKCYATGNVVGCYDVGGLVGWNHCSFGNCYATGSVEGAGAVGGLVGYNYEGIITNCYATGKINGAGGGLAGVRRSPCCSRFGHLEDSYWDIETSEEPNMCGQSGCDNAYGKTTAEMKRKSTFQGWDFINVWDIGENQTYPYLRTVPAGDINKDKTVNFLDVCIIAEQWCNEQ